MSADEWKQVQVKNICDVGRGRVISSQEIESNPGVYPVFSSQSQNSGEMGRIDTYDFDGEYVTWTTDGAYAGTVFYRTGRFNCTNVCGTLKAKIPQISMEFIAYKLSTLAKNYVSYVGNPKLMNNVMANIELSLPETKEEQAQIAIVLSTIDLAIAQTEAIIAKQQRIKTGLMQDLLTKGIDENGNIRSEETHEFKDSPLGRIPVEWEVSRLNHLIEIIDCKHFTPAYVKEGIPIIRPRNIKDYGFDFTDIDFVSDGDYKKLTDKHEPNQGDIIFSRNASFGIPVYVENSEKLCIGQDVVVMKNKNADTKFIFTALKSDSIVKQINLVSAGSTFGRIDLAAIRELLVKVPKSKQEQKEIASRIHQMDILQSNTQSDLRKLKFLKTGLMQDLLTGKIRVTELLNDIDRPTSIEKNPID